MPYFFFKKLLLFMECVSQSIRQIRFYSNVQESPAWSLLPWLPWSENDGIPRLACPDLNLMKPANWDVSIMSGTGWCRIASICLILSSQLEIPAWLGIWNGMEWTSLRYNPFPQLWRQWKQSYNHNNNCTRSSVIDRRRKPLFRVRVAEFGKACF